MAYCIANGSLYENSTSKELKIGNGVEARIQATGTGSCKITGKLTSNGTAKTLNVVSLGDFSVTDTITDDNIYACDVTGLNSITVSNASGFTKVYASVYDK